MSKLKTHPQKLYPTSAPVSCDRTLRHYTHPLNGPFPGLPRWAGTRKVKPIWILLKQETVSGSGINWAICKSAPHSRQITMPAPHNSVFYRTDALPAAQPCNGHEQNSLNLTRTWLCQCLLIFKQQFELGQGCYRTFCSRPTGLFCI